MGRNEHAERIQAYLEEVCERLPHIRQVRPWKEWTHGRMGANAAVGLALVFVCCGGWTNVDATGMTSGSPPAGGGGSGGSSTLPGGSGGTGGFVGSGGSTVPGGTTAGAVETDCDDGRDDDFDGVTDCADSDCGSSPVCEGSLTEDAPVTSSERRQRA